MANVCVNYTEAIREVYENYTRTGYFSILAGDVEDRSKRL